MTTPNIKLPVWAAAQDQPWVPENGAKNIIDALLPAVVVSDVLDTPPALPSAGACYIVAASATGAWAGWEKSIAAYIGGAWVQVTPQEGWVFWVVSNSGRSAYIGGAWVKLIEEAPNDGTAYARKNGAWVAASASSSAGALTSAYDIPMAFVGTPLASEIIGRYLVARSVSCRAHFSGAFGRVGTAPAADFVIDVNAESQSGVVTNIGTITISTSGGFVFETALGLPPVIEAGSLVTFNAPAGVDAALVDVAASLFGTSFATKYYIQPDVFTRAGVAIPDMSGQDGFLTAGDISNRALLKAATNEIGDGLLHLGVDGAGAEWLELPENYATEIGAALQGLEVSSKTAVKPAGYVRGTSRPRMARFGGLTNVIAITDSLGWLGGSTGAAGTDSYVTKGFQQWAGVTTTPMGGVPTREYVTSTTALLHNGNNGSFFGGVHNADFANDHEMMRPVKYDTLGLKDGDIFFVELGTNDWPNDGAVDAADVWARAQTFITGLLASNPAAKIIMTTIPRKSEVASVNADIDAYNTLLKAGYAALGVTAICDLEQAHPDFSATTGNSAGPAYLADGIHFSDVGRDAAATEFKNTLASIVSAAQSATLLTDLFANGEDGIWYDGTDISTLWQDVAGTVPVVNHGDPILRIDDKSGNGKYSTVIGAAHTWNSAGYIDLNGGYFRRATLNIAAASTAIFGYAGTADGATAWQIFAQNGGQAEKLMVSALKTGNGITSGIYETATGYVLAKSHAHSGAAGFSTVSGFDFTAITNDFRYNGLAPDGVVTPISGADSFMTLGAPSNGAAGYGISAGNSFFGAVVVVDPPAGKVTAVSDHLSSLIV